MLLMRILTKVDERWSSFSAELRANHMKTERIRTPDETARKLSRPFWTSEGHSAQIIFPLLCLGS